VSGLDATPYTFSEPSGNNTIEITLDAQQTIRAYSVRSSRDQFPKSMRLLDVENSSQIIHTVDDFEFTSGNETKLFLLKKAARVKTMAFDFSGNESTVSIGQIELYI